MLARVALLVLALGQTTAFATELPEVDEPDNLPPPTQPQEADAPAEAQTTPASYRKSVTLEAALGLGLVASGADTIGTGWGLSGLDLGVGGFVNPSLAVTGRVTGVLTRGDDAVSAIFFGGSVQYWIDDKLWFGGGAGLAYLGANGGSTNGFGLDVRAGYTLWQQGPHAFHVSLEVTPMRISGDFLTGIAVLAGYQYL